MADDPAFTDLVNGLWEAEDVGDMASALTECEGGGNGPGPRRTCEPATGDAARWFALIGIPQIPMHVNDLIFDDEDDSGVATQLRELPDAIPIAWYLVLVAVPGLVLWWRYQRLRT